MARPSWWDYKDGALDQKGEENKATHSKRASLNSFTDGLLQKLENLGATVELADVGKQTLPDGKEIPLPEVILASLGNVSWWFFLLIFSIISLNSGSINRIPR